MILVSTLIMGIRDTLLFFTVTPIQILSGVIGMIAVYCFMPTMYRDLLNTVFIFRCVHGLLTFIVGVVVSLSVNVIGNTNGGIDIYSYGFKPAYWLVIIGAIPSSIVGMFYLPGRRLTKR